ncbi:MAG: ATPase, T2SS/T4P/T4SS family [Planctomycetota bacterium]
MDKQRLESLLQAMHRVGATALFLTAGRPPSLRVQRRVGELDEPRIHEGAIEEFVRDLMFSDHREQLARTGSVEVLYLAKGGRRHRVAVTECEGRRAVVVRPLPQTVPTLESLELPDQLSAFTRCRSGLVLVGGFFGAGKTTTIAALVDQLRQDPTRHIVTIEDAIEFVHPPGAALLHQQEIAVHAPSAVAGIRQAIAMGVDTIVVGELDSEEALHAALAAVESGCLVLCGVEAGSVIGVLSDVILRAPIEARARLRTRLARALRGVTAQCLVQRSHRAGRIAAVEILLATPAVRNVIRSGELQELTAIMNRCRGLGMQTIDGAMRVLHAAHLVPADEVAGLPRFVGHEPAAIGR